MVLKILLVVTALNFLLPKSFAFTKVTYIKHLEFLYKSKQYDLLLEEYDEYSARFRLANNYLVLDYKALAEEGLNNYEDAINTYRRLINKNFPKRAQYFLRTLKEKDTEHMSKADQRLKYYYLRYAQLLTAKFLTLRKVNSKKTKRIQKIALRFVNVIKILDPDSEMALGLHEAIKNHTYLLIQNKFRLRYSADLGFISWQDNLNLINTGTNLELLNTSSGGILGIGIHYESYFKEYFFKLQYFNGSSTINSLDQNYHQAGVSVTAYKASTGILWKTFADNVSLGGELIGLSRSSDWSVPGPGFRLSNTSYLRFGYGLITKWHVKYFEMYASLGKIFKNTSSIFQFNISYKF